MGPGVSFGVIPDPPRFLKSPALDRALQPKDDPFGPVECGHGCRGLAEEVSASDSTRRSFAVSEIDADILPEVTDVDLERSSVCRWGTASVCLGAISGLAAAETSAAPSASTGATPHDAAERRQLTVMFCDLVGSTALSVRFDPEELRDEIRAYQNAVLVGVVARYDGFVAKFMGDGPPTWIASPDARTLVVWSGSGESITMTDMGYTRPALADVVRTLVKINPSIKLDEAAKLLIE